MCARVGAGHSALVPEPSRSQHHAPGAGQAEAEQGGERRVAAGEGERSAGQVAGHGGHGADATRRRAPSYRRRHRIRRYRRSHHRRCRRGWCPGHRSGGVAALRGGPGAEDADAVAADAELHVRVDPEQPTAGTAGRRLRAAAVGGRTGAEHPDAGAAEVGLHVRADVDEAAAVTRAGRDCWLPLQVAPVPVPNTPTPLPHTFACTDGSAVTSDGSVGVDPGSGSGTGSSGAGSGGTGTGRDGRRHGQRRDVDRDREGQRQRVGRRRPGPGDEQAGGERERRARRRAVGGGLGSGRGVHGCREIGLAHGSPLQWVHRRGRRVQERSGALEPVNAAHRARDTVPDEKFARNRAQDPAEREVKGSGC